ncbi:unnamed protein product [Rotaria sordida]|uniref:Uncharacterized protein n=1 Tax=Rotaria sordida TaxID=392033 RepID=A0A814I5H4_9BILA|nr:unnamed protein product [Rotaria sordida]CAF1019004.1 unnamed protein product [Rotaria sordida]CAF1476637.1 unnamed protein product [Rotaria sordida]CAF1646742.1 unnamed protein product [Rotaria sordida]CAF3863431.1 unnamed protein product [Rotaria sordida]
MSTVKSLIKRTMSSNEQNFNLNSQAGSIGQAGGAFSERGRAAENAYFHAQEAEQLAALKQQLEQQQQQQQDQSK